MSEEKLNTRERNTLYWTWQSEEIHWAARLDTLRKLAELGLIDIRVTAKGLMVLEDGRHPNNEPYTGPTPYAAQVRHATRHPEDPDRGWTTLFRGRTEYEAAEQLWETLQREGFRTGELPAHIADLAKEHVLSTERGVEFRVLRRAVIDVEEIGEH